MYELLVDTKRNRVNMLKSNLISNFLEYRVSSNKRWASNKRRSIDTQSRISAAPQNEALIRNLAII